MEIWIGQERYGDHFINVMAFTNQEAAIAWMEEVEDRVYRQLAVMTAHAEWPPGVNKADINDPAVMDSFLTNPTGTRVKG